MTHSVVFVPGIMGSELRLNGQRIWPGPASSLVFEYELLDELLHDDTEPTDIIRSYSVSKQYSHLMDDLERCGFSEDGSKPTLFAFPYDWRKSNSDAAARLADKIDQIVDMHGDESEISIVAHSMGGLVSRCYLESGDYSGRPGIEHIKTLITLGTPHLGAPMAIKAALGKEKRLWLSKEQVQIVATDPRYPSLYQLLPPSSEPFAWNRSAGEEFSAVDVFDEETASDLGLVKENLESATKFWEQLDTENRPEDVRYFFFGGTREKTLSHVQLLRRDGKFSLDKAEEQKDAGDGTVPSWSSRLPGIQGQPVGGEHGSIYKTDRLRRTLGILLGHEGVLAGEIRTLELTIFDQVVYPEESLGVSLNFAERTAEVKGDLEIERAIFNDQQELVGYRTLGRPYDVAYRGPNIEKLELNVLAPNIRGLYRVSFTLENHPESVDSKDFFVQTGCK